MIIFPAIDIIAGEAVRLYKGDFAQKKVYSSDPVSVAKEFKKAGATHVHLVDLDGAKAGEPKNFDLVCRIKRETGLFVEIGGGIRERETIDQYLKNGIDRVILGTIAVTDPSFIPSLPKDLLKRIAVGVDVQGKHVAIKGWQEISELELFDFCKLLQKQGVGTVICTDISKDGAMSGTNHNLYRDLKKEIDMKIVASGGVGSIDDIKKLKEQGFDGAIIGKAYYEGTIDLAKAVEVAR